MTDAGAASLSVLGPTVGRSRVAVLVSGGQSGVDRAALDLALELESLGIGYDGWCPRGGWAEDLPDPPGLLVPYPLLRETPSADPAERTVRNVRDSDATLVLRPGTDPASPRTGPGSPGPGRASPGTDLTLREAGRLGRPLLVCDGRRPDPVRSWLHSLPTAVRLHVAGPRASEWPEGYAVATALLRQILP